jgi:SSS family solute:Na+ symporter
MFAAIAGAVVSSLASMLNSASTVFTMDIYNRTINREASQKRLVLLGRISTLAFVVIGCLIAPLLANPKFGGVFNFIQQFQGYIWPGVVAAFVLGFLLKKAPPAAGVAALVSGPLIYAVFQKVSGLHFLIQVTITFFLVCLIMVIFTLANPLKQPRVLPVREEMTAQTEPVVKIVGGLVIAAVVLFYIIFW